MPVPTCVWVKRPLELGRRLRGGVAWPSLLEAGLRENLSVLTNTLLSNVSRSRQTVFILVETPWPGPASLWALILWVLWQVLQLGSALELVLQNPHLA